MESKARVVARVPDRLLARRLIARVRRVLRMTEAEVERVWRAGREAGYGGRRPSWVNPYVEGTGYADVWGRGWREGRKEWERFGMEVVDGA